MTSETPKIWFLWSQAFSDHRRFSFPDTGRNRLNAKKVERKLMENFTIRSALDACNRGIKLDNKF